MRDTLQAWDEAVLLALNGQPRWLDTPAWWLTSNWAAMPVVLLIFWTLYRIGTRHGAPRRAWLGLAALILTFAGTDALSSRVMKPGFARLRPSHAEALDGHLHHHTFEDGSVYRGGRFGFVSSHAANTFGIATLTVLLFGAGRWRWLWLWAAAMSWTRIYLGVHYPGDILFGALFGAGWACAIFTAFRRFSPALSTP